MLLSLYVRDFVIVEECSLDLGPGFTVFSGETGAGKSILIDALALVLGEKADAGVVRQGAARTELSATFQLVPALQDWLIEQELVGEDNVVLLRRSIDVHGKSRAFINGTPVTQTQLRECGSFLVDIHGQHAHQSLVKASAQRALLDTHAGLEGVTRAVAEAYRVWQLTQQERESFEQNRRATELERERLQWQYDELTRLAPQPGEWENIHHEHQRLSHAAGLIEGAQRSVATLSEDDGAVQVLLAQVLTKVRALVGIDPSLENVVQCLDSAEAQVSEAVSELNHYLARLELDPERLFECDKRLESLHSMARKYRVNAENLPAELGRIKDALRTLNETADLDAWRLKEEQAYRAYEEQAKKLSLARRVAGASLAQAVTAAMQSLSMEGGQFAIQFVERVPAAHGLEDVEFFVAAHAGVEPRPLAKVASGGELARLSLAISVITSTATATPTLIFDEVDSGIGGAVAEVVGRLLKQLGSSRQVLCVTHLAQVAAQADVHYGVEKVRGEASTVSHVHMLNASERVDEIARMLGGATTTAATRQAAQEMLG